MVNACHFLNVAECGSLFRQNKESLAEQNFTLLKPRARKEIQQMLFWQQSGLLKRTVFTLLGRVWNWVGPCLGGRVEVIWRGASSEQKAKAIELFVNKRVQEKLSKETRAATTQGVYEKSARQFDAPLIAKTPNHLFSTPLSHQVKKVAQGLLFPWGLYALYSHFTVRDASDHSVGIAHAQGRRPSMEDAHLIRKFSFQGEKVELFAVFDGHGGDSAAKHARSYFETHLKRALAKQCKEGLSDRAIFLALKQACLTLDASYKGLAGTTACVTLIMGGKLWTCNIGDSRSVLVQKGKALQLSEDQKCDNPKYAKGVEKRGGMILQHLGVGPMRVNGNLAVPRAIGDHLIRGKNGEDCIVHTPKITCRSLSEISPGSHLVIGCDGIWDVCSSSQAAEFVQKQADKSASQIAHDLVARAYRVGSGDNLSALVVKL